MFKREPEVYVVSYPKSGRTWLRVLLGKALCTQYGLDEGLLLETRKLTAKAGVSRTRFVHDAFDADRFAGKSVVHLIREPKDVLVSGYFQATRRDKAFEGTLSEFVRSDRFGIRAVLDFQRLWHEHRDVPRELVVLRYAELHADPAGALRTLLACVGADVSDAVVEEAVAFARFENMQRMEATGYFKEQAGRAKLRPGDPADPDSFKVRRGVVGGWKEALSAEDVAYVDEVIAGVR